MAGNVNFLVNQHLVQWELDNMAERINAEEKFSRLILKPSEKYAHINIDAIHKVLHATKRWKVNNEVITRLELMDNRLKEVETDLKGIFDAKWDELEETHQLEIVTSQVKNRIHVEVFDTILPIVMRMNKLQENLELQLAGMPIGKCQLNTGRIKDIEVKLCHWTDKLLEMETQMNGQ